MLFALSNLPPTFDCRQRSDLLLFSVFYLFVSSIHPGTVTARRSPSISCPFNSMDPDARERQRPSTYTWPCIYRMPVTDLSPSPLLLRNSQSGNTMTPGPTRIDTTRIAPSRPCSRKRNGN
ncbi:hypothetical protein EDB86DRAFT_2336966 [Lactarius hatsudake]|nr:hypothetical protein EDB86DRAFT_2336966 [Lactarius hatsudake]